MNTGDTSFILVSTALVFFMTPGLAFFYGGLVRRKNVLNTIMASFFILGLAAVLWVLVGYSLAFGKDTGGFIGNLQWFALNGVGADPNPDYSATIPQSLFAAFQMMFAIITPAILTGALVERIKFSALFIFIGLWCIIVYYPMAHMVWGVGGFIRELGAIDFAGGTVGHMSSGISALVAAIVIGRRKGLGMATYRPHNIPFVVLGASILWFGWFGFNAGSALGANGLAAHAFMTTNTATAAALLSWMLIEKILRGKPTLLGAATGAGVGLASITQGAGFVPVWAAAITGAAASVICYFALSVLKSKMRYDDSLDAFGCHGIGGIWGCMMTGVFAQTSINSAARWNGLIYGDFHLFVVQLIGILTVILLSVIGTFIIMTVLKKIMRVRVMPGEETKGLDITQHNENAYPSFTGMD